jgi:hypothetical protein
MAQKSEMEIKKQKIQNITILKSNVVFDDSTTTEWVSTS